MMLIDTKKKTIERYDPHGVAGTWEFHTKLLDKALKDFFKKELPGYKNLYPLETCPFLGFQPEQELQKEAVKQMEQLAKHLKKEIGFCVGWSLFYINLRLKYPDVNPKKLQEMAIAKLKKGDMTNFIKNYVTYLSKL